MRAPPDFPVGGKTVPPGADRGLRAGPGARHAVRADRLLVGGERRKKAKLLAKGEDPDGDAATLDVLAALETFGPVHPDPEAFLECLEPLQPRLYSISSSPLATPGEVHLTVDAVRYDIGGRTRLGVASTFLADRLRPGARVKVYVQKAHGFALPEDRVDADHHGRSRHRRRAVPLLPAGTASATQGATGQAWLFFGHQREASDFFYRDELRGLLADGTLTRLSTAWSRDGAEKVYVQDRMREAGAELWAWLKARRAFLRLRRRQAHGQGRRDARLPRSPPRHGQMSEAAASDFIAELKAAGRYQADVY